MQTIIIMIIIFINNTRYTIYYNQLCGLKPLLTRYTAEQEDIKNMKEYVARFGHGTATNARQAKSKQKLLDKKLNSGY
jgi:hypothetical protein